MTKNFLNRNAVKFGELNDDIRVGNLPGLLPMNNFGVSDSELARSFPQPEVCTLAKLFEMGTVFWHTV